MIPQRLKKGGINQLRCLFKVAFSLLPEVFHFCWVKVGKLIWKEGLEGPSTYNFENISPDASFIARAIFWTDYYGKEQLRGSEVPLFSDAKATKGRRTGALSGDCSYDSSKAATTSRDALSGTAVRVPLGSHGRGAGMPRR